MKSPENFYRVILQKLSRTRELYPRVLASCLKSSQLSDSERSELLGFLRNRNYSALVNWADSVSSTAYEDVPSHFGRNQLAALIRKYPFTQSELPFDRRKAALEKFFLAEEACRVSNDSDLLSENELQRMRGWIQFVIGSSPHLPSIYSKCSFGPGASIGVTGLRTNFAAKLAADHWSVTPAALPYALAALSGIPGVHEFLCKGAVCCYESLYRDDVIARCKVVRHNKVAFVPKTAKTDRSIAVEPLLNGFLQKGIGDEMAYLLKRRGLNIFDQSPNVRMARKGSLEWQEADPFCTIDLSSASDTVSRKLVESIVPEEWYSLLNAARSKFFITDEGNLVEYEKFSSMGNGFTFPLETLIFSAAVKAVDPGATPGKDFVVYGDDIIVRKSKYADTVALLGRMGFSVNSEKSFFEGPFRESCGGDFFGGQDVRPVYLTYRLDTVESLIKFFNSFSRGVLTENFAWQIRKDLLSWFPELIAFSRPWPGNADSAIEVPLDLFLGNPLARWNRRMQCWSWIELHHSAREDRKLRLHSKWPILLHLGALKGNPSKTTFALRGSATLSFRREANAGATSTWLPIDGGKNP